MFDKMTTEETDDPGLTKMKIISLLSRANEYVWMSSGFNPEFYNDVGVKKAIEDALQRVKQFRIIIDGDVHTKKNEVGWLFEQLKNPKNKNVLEIRQCIGVPHWLISDGKHFRLEKPHVPGIIRVSNLLVYDVNRPVLSEILKRKFNEWWMDCKTINLENTNELNRQEHLNEKRYVLAT